MGQASTNRILKWTQQNSCWSAYSQITFLCIPRRVLWNHMHAYVPL